VCRDQVLSGYCFIGKRGAEDLLLRVQGICYVAMMADVFSEKKRSEVMSKIRGKGNLSTEKRMISLLRKHQIKGWRRHLNVAGKPDFAFKREKVALFVDGCFWHRCPRCYSPPKNNAQFWENKIMTNRRRDRRITRQLRGEGWSVLRIWECSLRKHPNSTIKRVIRSLER